MNCEGLHGKFEVSLHGYIQDISRWPKFQQTNLRGLRKHKLSYLRDLSTNCPASNLGHVSLRARGRRNNPKSDHPFI
ncbi:hypothetical protein M8J76_011862 [Diaphorina citri]|nr:hypothetical protein M8J76_011862 [Diaphorina citri]